MGRPFKGSPVKLEFVSTITNTGSLKALLFLLLRGKAGIGTATV